LLFCQLSAARVFVGAAAPRGSVSTQPLCFLTETNKTQDVFQIVFVCANGPLAWAILAFNQSLVLHKWPQITSGDSSLLFWSPSSCSSSFFSCSVYPRISGAGDAGAALARLRLRRVRELAGLPRHVAPAGSTQFKCILIVHQLCVVFVLMFRVYLLLVFVLMCSCLVCF
jgi:hypothetical protein